MHTRWYEQNPDLNEVFTFIQTLDEEAKSTLALYLLQILVTECDIDLDKEISKFSKNNYSYKRWYDEDFNLSSAFELLKGLPENKQQYVVKRFLSEIVMSFIKEEL